MTNNTSLPAMDAETRAAYFAQYWGQNVVNPIGQHSRIGRDFHPRDVQCIELTPLHLISAEHGKLIAQMTAVNVDSVRGDYDGFWITIKSRGGRTKKTTFFWYRDLVQRQVDTLRQLGYALPFRGYSVDQLVELGVLGLKEK